MGIYYVTQVQAMFSIWRPNDNLWGSLISDVPRQFRKGDLVDLSLGFFKCGLSGGLCKEYQGNDF